MGHDPLNLVKLCVGVKSVADLAAWQTARAATARGKGLDYLPWHITRMWPKRTGEILNGGSLYWVFRGQVLARQPILAFEPVTGDDGIRRCKIVMSRAIIPTQAAPRRPFQGWRYLSAADSPPDLVQGREGDDELPSALHRALGEIGVR